MNTKNTHIDIKKNGIKHLNRKIRHLRAEIKRVQGDADRWRADWVAAKDVIEILVKEKEDLKLRRIENRI